MEPILNYKGMAGPRITTTINPYAPGVKKVDGGSISTGGIDINRGTSYSSGGGNSSKNIFDKVDFWADKAFQVGGYVLTGKEMIDRFNGKNPPDKVVVKNSQTGQSQQLTKEQIAVLVKEAQNQSEERFIKALKEISNNPPPPPPKNNTMTYVAIGVGAVAILGLVMVVATKK